MSYKITRCWGYLRKLIGRTLDEYARALFALEREAEDVLSSLRHLEGGTLRIGASTNSMVTGNILDQ